MNGVEVKMNTVFSMGFGRGLSRWSAGMALVLGMALVGCRGCSDSEPVAEEVKVRAKQKEDRAEKQKRRASNRADLKKLRSLKLRAPHAVDVDRELSEEVEMLATGGAEGCGRRAGGSACSRRLADHPNDADALLEWSCAGGHE